jgi:glycoside/pentoside/hexuronide:cation symporter, GPH family
MNISNENEINHHVHYPKKTDHVSLKTRIGWGAGGIADNFIMNALNILGLLLYVDYFKLSPILAGIAMFIPRFIDAVSDPIIGNISDNTRSRWGRRRPYILVGAVFSAILLPFLWMPPFLATAGNPWYCNGPFWYLTVIGCIYTTCYTIFCVPYTAIGFELTNDYDERTRTLAWRMYLGLGAGFLLPWLYYFCTLKIFPNEAVGARWVCLFLSIIIVITGVIPSIVCREKTEALKQESINFIEAVKYTITNRSFVIMLIAYVIILVGLFSSTSINMFLYIYYLFDGSKEIAGKFNGVLGLVASIVSYFSMFIVAGVSVRFDKKNGMIAGLAFALVGNILAWFAIDPRWPYAYIIPTIIMFLGWQGCWLMIDSMVADICDEDELKTGLRREGMFGAVKSFVQKASISITGLTGGILLWIAGFDQNTVGTTGMSEHTGITLKALILGVQVVGCLVGIIIFRYYQIDRKRSVETRRILDERKSKKDKTATV